MIDLKKHQVCYQATVTVMVFYAMYLKAIEPKNITYKLYILTFQDAKELLRCKDLEDLFGGCGLKWISPHTSFNSDKVVNWFEYLIYLWSSLSK